MRGGKPGTSVIQLRVPEFKVVNFRVVKKGRWIIGFFLSGCCMAQRVVVRAVALLSAKPK